MTPFEVKPTLVGELVTLRPIQVDDTGVLRAFCARTRRQRG